MKLRLLYTAVFLFAFSAGMRADNLGYSKANPLLFGVDTDYAPLQYVDAEGMPHGVDVEFTQELMKRLSIPFTYAPNTWKNISGDVLSGRVDLGMMVYSPYRKDIINYSRAVFRMYYQIVYRKDNKQEFDVRNLSGKSVAYMASRPVGDTLTKVGAVSNIVEDLTQAMQDLADGKYDAVICFRHQTNYLTRKLGLDNLKSQDMTLTPREYCYVSHSKPLIDAINAELEKMETAGDISRIYGVDITSEFGKIVIPTWIYAVGSVLIILFLLVIIYLMQSSRKQLRREMKRARQSEELKSVFLSNVSHALRTPLNAIIGFSDLMMSDRDGMMGPEERRQLLELVNKNGLDLLHFINELLELSDIEGNQQLFDRVVTDLEQEMEAYAAEARMQLKEGVGMAVEPPAKGIRAYLDPKLMRMVTTHLLQNAVDHTEQGRVTLTFGPRDGGLYVSVADTGCGLPEDLKENIFSLLSNKSTYVREETPGLGLNICKAIIDKCGGKIGASDNEGGGTVVWYWVPVKIL